MNIRHRNSQRLNSKNPSDVKNTAPALSGDAEAKSKNLQDFHILVVDDERDLRNAIAFDFSRKGFSVYTAENGLEALEIIRKKEIDLVLSDMRMPNCDGLTLLKKIRETDGKIPDVIFITAYSQATEAECLANGALQVFPKPYNRQELMQAVLELASSRLK